MVSYDAMRSLLQANRVVVALGANAVLLLLILVSVSTRDSRALAGWSGSLPETPQPSKAATGAPAGPVTVMPCQLSMNTWGCYVMDPQNQTLCVYQYLPHEELKLLAARDIQYDRKLGVFNTSPSPNEIKAMVERTEEPVRAAPATNRSPESAPGR
jgi:hypothetical protein